MASAAQRTATGAGSIPELAFAVEGVESVEHSAVPMLRFALRISSLGGAPIRAILLDVQIQIAARRRPYDESAKAMLADLFGTPDRWGQTLRTLPWTRITVVAPPFTRTAVVDVPVTCTYDLEVSAAQYLQALGDGEVPLEFLFSGTIFYSNHGGALQTARIPWTQEAEYGLPVRAWREAIDRHFPDSAWVRLSRASFDRLRTYRAGRALPSWDDALDSLLPKQGADRDRDG
jgi:Family of unknown function (DUF6084)